MDLYKEHFSSNYPSKIMENLPQDSIRSDRSAVKRLSDRGHYERAMIDSILDAQVLCHISFVHDGRAHVIPTLYGRDGDRVLFHGSALSRMLDAAGWVQKSVSVSSSMRWFGAPRFITVPITEALFCMENRPKSKETKPKRSPAPHQRASAARSLGRMQAAQCWRAQSNHGIVARNQRRRGKGEGAWRQG
ncbi:MAG: pyridoxamine 5'-phosphate oxidase family protein [Bacteroidetes bacterium]|nr:pyridoxamine 5'-phosphate oxidase family protein [Bacteroidota bacterium]